MDTEQCISVTQQPLTSQDPTQVTTLETPSLMAHVSRVLFLVAIMVVAMVVLPPSHVHWEKKKTTIQLKIDTRIPCYSISSLQTF
jgi:hypothetical protein